MYNHNFSARYEWIHEYLLDGFSFYVSLHVMTAVVSVLACSAVCGAKKKNSTRSYTTINTHPPRSGAQEKRWTRGESNPGPLPGLDSKHIVLARC